jgi:hypothetical protein
MTLVGKLPSRDTYFLLVSRAPLDRAQVRVTESQYQPPITLDDSARFWVFVLTVSLMAESTCRWPRVDTDSSSRFKATSVSVELDTRCDGVV